MKLSLSTPLAWTAGGIQHMAIFRPNGRGRVWFQSTELGTQDVSKAKALQYIEALQLAYDAEFLPAVRKPRASFKDLR